MCSWSSETLHLLFSKVKLVNDLLFGIHLATAAEAMVLGARAGLNTRILFDIISNAAGSSWYALQPTVTVYYPRLFVFHTESSTSCAYINQSVMLKCILHIILAVLSILYFQGSFEVSASRLLRMDAL